MIQLESSTESVFWVLVLRRHIVRRDLMTLAYRVECFLSLPLDPLITLSSSHFTWGKIVSKCNVTFERYRSSYSYIPFAHIIGYSIQVLWVYDLIKSMLTLSAWPIIYCFLHPCIILSINILFPFFRLEQDNVRQGIFEAIKFRGSPKWPNLVISVAFDFHEVYQTCSRIYMLYILVYTWK